MKKLNKNNKGFSLVEIIVVILIMAIITVALAPQVLKWVNNARISSDTQTADSVKGNIQLALANEGAYNEAKSNKIVVTINKSGDATLKVGGTNCTDNTNAFAKAFFEVCGSYNEFKSTKAKSVDSFTVEYENGAFKMPDNFDELDD